MTTIYGWDTSHYDGTLTTTTLNRAKSEGIVFWTHKLGEGLDNTDPAAAAAFAAAKGIFPVIGGYYFLHAGQSTKAQATRCVSLADQLVPWWRDFDGWFFQTDAEAESPYGLPSPAEVRAFSDELAAQSDRTVIVYASAGQYGNRLDGLGHYLWNAHYGTNPVGPFKAVYPGNSSAGWSAYSGQTPVLLQYGSNTIIAGLTTCDANAFRGTVDQLLALINPHSGGGDVPVTQPTTTANVSKAVLDTSGMCPNPDPDSATLPKTTLNTAIYRIRTTANATLAQSQANAATLAELVKTEAAIQATLDAMAAGGRNVNTAELAARIKAVGDAESATVAALREQIADLTARLAVAEEAALAALNPPSDD